MQPIVPSQDALAVLRAIAREGFSYQRTKELGQAAGWKLVEDDLKLGYVGFDMGAATGQGFPLRLTVEVGEGGGAPRAFVPLFYFDDDGVQREPLDQAYRSLEERLAGLLGPPSTSGEYAYQYRESWRYFYSGWSLSDATFVLVQDELDIQFGLDVTLWVLPAGAAIAVPMSGG